MSKQNLVVYYIENTCVVLYPANQTEIALFQEYFIYRHLLHTIIKYLRHA